MYEELDPINLTGFNWNIVVVCTLLFFLCTSPLEKPCKDTMCMVSLTPSGRTGLDRAAHTDDELLSGSS